MENRIEQFHYKGEKFIFYDVRQRAVIGLDGIKRTMVNSILKMSGRNNIKFFRTRDEAIK
ncbi:MAG: hypothetical protein LBC60_06455 [Spirochaetaceae bacterium]|jgi:hypothetical protein|nr:hypothetical protein [Spirochaetaceae bacterium]